MKTMCCDEPRRAGSFGWFFAAVYGAGCWRHALFVLGGYVRLKKHLFTILLSRPLRPLERVIQLRRRGRHGEAIVVEQIDGDGRAGGGHDPADEAAAAPGAEAVCQPCKPAAQAQAPQPPLEAPRPPRAPARRAGRPGRGAGRQ